ncbi:ribonuclease BN [Enterococcus plantarum]|uniref:YihY/virulence factor BrkB family protein n=1 Tax=Enterococcus plantarum TaxID=1077675 RepID=A0A2W3Z2X8_9ENTE|nr:YihY/virulence factor BrkB family protein [Enterococcus plantarum]MBO0423887.1 YihY/virulence factor BrkB family protein [Enterococcus plantarum]MBO0467763.1 YihY/virulence factor BrkB family protein [Enterococcus plantarum]OEG09434.1 ribonuclease BN [Enterococcus plantarum]PZL71690.1 YihY/virulence factor BrkB family protein [Enterococcus plantarum]
MKLVDKVKRNEKLMRFIETTQHRMIDSEIGNTSVVVAYYLLLSLFPLLIAVGNLLPYLHIDPNEVLPYIAEAIPKAIFEDLKPAIQSLLTQRSGGLLSISALAALWSASQSINALQTAMNKAFGVEQRKNFIIVRIMSLLVILLFMIAIVGVVGVLGLGKTILDLLQPIVHFSTDFIDTFQALKWPITSLVLLVIMCLIYRVVPNAKLTFRSIIPGAIFATAGWMLLSQAFGLYIKYFSSKIASYQIIGSFIILMLWLNFAATIIILGGIINAVVKEYLSNEKIQHRYGLINRLVDKAKEKLKK